MVGGRAVGWGREGQWDGGGRGRGRGWVKAKGPGEIRRRSGGDHGERASAATALLSSAAPPLVETLGRVREGVGVAVGRRLVPQPLPLLLLAPPEMWGDVKRCGEM